MRASQITYQPGHQILKQGDEGDEFYIVNSGRVDCQYEEDVEGKRVRHLGAGDFFGEGALLTDKPRSMCVSCWGAREGEGDQCHD